MDYIIKRTDYTNNGQFIIRPYTTNGPASPNTTIPLAPNAVSANTSVILLGKGMYEYGELIASNFVHMLENFSNATSPVYPIQGQLWYKNTTKEMFIHDGTSFNIGHPIILNGLLTSELDVNSHRIVNVAAPINPTDAMNLSYFTSSALTIAGGTMNPTANIAFVGGGEILGLPAIPSSNTSATSKLYVDTLLADGATAAGGVYVKKIGDTLTGNLIMSADTRIFLPTPSGTGFIGATEVVNKSYVDSTIGGTGLFVKSAGDTMTGTLEINGATIYTGIKRLISAVTSGAGTSSVTLSGGDYTSSFHSGVKFSANLGLPLHGYQEVALTGTIVGGTSTGLIANTTPATAGNVTIDFTSVPTLASTSAVGIAAGSYDITVTVDGLGNNYTITATGTDTLGDIATLIGVAVPGVITSVVSSSIVITSTTTGVSSSVVLTEPTIGTNPDLLVSIDTALAGTHTTTPTTGSNAIPNTTPYTFDVVIDGTLHVVSVLGSAAQTYTTLLSEINADLVTATATLVGNNIRITSPSISSLSTVAITDGTLLQALTAYGSILPAVVGNTVSMQTLTTIGSSFVSPDTVVHVSDNISAGATPGDYAYPMWGLRTFNNAPVSIDGDLVITGSRNIDFNNNVIHNVSVPVVSSDVATKGYVDGKGGVSEVTVNGPTKELTFGGVGVTPVVVNLTPMFTSPSHTHVSKEVLHNIRTPAATGGNRYRKVLSDPTHPSVQLSDVLDITGNDLYELTRRNLQYVTSVTSYSIIDFTSASADLTVSAVSTGVASSITVPGDVTQTFKLGIQFTLTNNTGAGGVGSVVWLHTISSTYNSGPNNTTILIVETLPNTITADGILNNLYGAIQLAGNQLYHFPTGFIKFNISGNSGTGNGDYAVSTSTYTGSNTWVYLYRLTPIPVGMAGDGIIQLYSFVTPFQYVVETNKLMVHSNGIKQYKSTRGTSALAVINNAAPTFITDTTLVNGTYTINIAVDGGAPVVVSNTVNHPTFTVLAVDEINKKITVSGSHVSDFFEFEVIKLTGNTGIPVTSQFTVVRSVLNAGNTDIIVESMPSTGFTNNGSIRQPYEYQHLFADLTTGISSGLGATAVLEFDDGNFLVTSGTTGNSSQIHITDGNLVAALPHTVIVNTTSGTTFAYNEPGTLFVPTNVVHFELLPTIGHTIEFLLTR
jgi:hypothetical protein